MTDRDVEYYRQRAAACQRQLDTMCAVEAAAPGHIERVTRDRDLWRALADELEVFLRNQVDVDEHDVETADDVALF